MQNKMTDDLTTVKNGSDAATASPVARIAAAPAGLLAVLLVGLGVALLAASAKVAVPFYPVPITLQTLAVLTIGITYRWRLGAATIVSYLALGAAGAPVFAAGGGAAYFVGPTGGFLLGFVPAVLFTGWAVQRGWARGFWRVSAVLAIADALIFICGFAYLATLIGAADAWAKGVLPFVLGDLAKVIAVSAGVSLAHLARQRWQK